VIAMTKTMKQQRRLGVAAVGAAFAVAMIFGPGQLTTARLGASETVGQATVTAADTIRSAAVLDDVPAAGGRVFKAT
jgi:hypothetical protein